MKVGLQTEAHLTVPDDRSKILEALKFLEPWCDFLFVTGGLGPTSDDFTRDLVSEWSGRPLEYHENSWRKIEDRLKSRGLPVAEFQRQQCFFPRESQVLENSVGTANAFYLERPESKKARHVWVLPGPPNEIAAIWKDHVEGKVKDLTQGLDPYLTYSWDALGIGEALAPTLIEPVVQGSGAEIGYRVHMPYLEIKISFYQSDESKMKPIMVKIDEALKPYTVARNGHDLLHDLAATLDPQAPLFICDEVSKGLFLNRLHSLRQTNLTYTTSRETSPQNAGKQGWQIQLLNLDEFSFELRLQAPHKLDFQKVIESPLSRSPHMSERRRQYFAEMALITAAQHWRLS